MNQIQGRDGHFLKPIKQGSQTIHPCPSPLKRQNTCPADLSHATHAEILVTPNKCTKNAGDADNGKSPLVSSGKCSRGKRFAFQKENDLSAIREESGSKLKSSAGKRDKFDSSAKKRRFCDTNAPRKGLQVKRVL